MLQAGPGGESHGERRQTSGRAGTPRVISAPDGRGQRRRRDSASDSARGGRATAARHNDHLGLRAPAPATQPSRCRGLDQPTGVTRPELATALADRLTASPSPRAWPDRGTDLVGDQRRGAPHGRPGRGPGRLRSARSGVATGGQLPAASGGSVRPRARGGVGGQRGRPGRRPRRHRGHRPVDDRRGPRDRRGSDRGAGAVPGGGRAVAGHRRESSRGRRGGGSAEPGTAYRPRPPSAPAGTEPLGRAPAADRGRARLWTARAVGCAGRRPVRHPGSSSAPVRVHGRLRRGGRRRIDRADAARPARSGAG